MSDLGWGALATLGAAALLLFIVTVVVVFVLLVKMIKKYRLVKQPGMPISAKVAFYGSIAYTILPFDVLPDPVLLDDIGVLIGALIYVGHTAKKVYGSLPRGHGS
ncbi:MAG TPA: YkvA family protein [Pseudonocardiaceae bacterium]|nr:YkvA family protein [Pseudonocardiaceae bacterium]